MDKVHYRTFKFNARRHLVDFIGSAYPSHIASGAFVLIGAAIVWSMLPHGTATSGAPAVQVRAPRPDPGVIAQQVAMAHLFGEDPSLAASGEARAAADIRIEGIIYSDDRTSALVILKIDGESGIFRVGDTLADGEKVLALAPTAMELGGRGAPRVLRLAQDFGDGDTASLLAGISAGAGLAQAFPGLPADAPGAYASALRPVMLSQGPDPLSELRSLRQQLIKRPPPLAPVHTAKDPSKP